MAKTNGRPSITLWPPKLWFAKAKWKRDMSPHEAAHVIDRFLAGTSSYAQEWTDFAETRQQDTRVERFRKRCDALEPLVNRPGPMDENAVAELRSMIEELRSMAGTEAVKL